ncbi:multidrug ABC transporter ATP-binding protein [Planotetraspora thailandica]|uniref:Multidrug ABC transporter ATP-binding protein n=1 Tax=Planotetraspora thailandica TaxID=487172 RepID=A0A8J3XWY3_9ACTN|nr:ABC transporter ATP-binding protein [Planotetraspora thailandica]GII52248.1 multidrug ABC transporter ATP-binding protein [Planotetraspora thailandica]
MAIITVENLHKTYGTHVAVDDVSFSVDEGEIFGIVGRNGAGKTTTVECVAGLRTPTSGRVTVDADLKQQVGVQLQDCTLPDKIRVGEALALYASFYSRPADWRALLEETGLDPRTAFAKLSGGQRQRLSIALALVGNPRIAILDELTTGLDPQARRDTWESIARMRERGVTVLLISHFMEEIERLCDRVLVVSAGRALAIDTPAGLVVRVSGGQRISFRTSASVDALKDLPDVTSVSRDGDEVVVTGTDDVLTAVVNTLPASQLSALRMERTTLDDAFLALTGHPAS